MPSQQNGQRGFKFDLLTLAAVAFLFLLLAWMAWELTRGEWPFRGAVYPSWHLGGLAKMGLASALEVVTAGFLCVVLYLAVTSKSPKSQADTVSRVYLASWHRRQFAILSPLVFLFAYAGVLILLSVYDAAIGSDQYLPLFVQYLQFWHEPGPTGLSLVTSILWTNVLAVVYLWLSFRSYRSSIRRVGVVLYLPYVVSLLFLVAVHDHYYKISQVSPSFSVLTLPHGNPLAIPGHFPDEPDPYWRDPDGHKAVYEPPRKISTSYPQWTDAARSAGLSGEVRLEIVIDRQGNVEVVDVLQGLPMGLTQEAVEAVKAWKYVPATLNGKPVSVYDYVSVTFR